MCASCRRAEVWEVYQIKKAMRRSKYFPSNCFSYVNANYVLQVPASYVAILRGIQHAARLVFHLRLQRNQTIPNHRCRLQDAVASLAEHQ